MIDPTFGVAFAGAIAKSSLLNVVRDGVVDFLSEKAKDMAGDEVKNKIEALRSDAKLNKQIEQALLRAAQRWLDDSPDIELVTAVAKDTTFADLASVKKAIRKVALAPYNSIATDTLRGSFKDVLPLRFEQERVEQGISEFLNILREEFAAIPALQPTLQTFASLQTANYTAVLPQIEDHLNLLLHGPSATEETLRTYLNWVVDQHRYLDPKGTMQTVRQVQVLLGEVFISLQAEEELPLGGVDRKLYEDEIKAIQEREGLQHEERDDLLDDFHFRYFKEEDRTPTDKPIELTELTRNNEKLIILGDPGAGKTTLMRYLALRHAQELRAGMESSEELGKVFLPLYLRIADYAEHGDGQSLENFLPLHICGRDHADKSLLPLITEQLDQGKCIILLDGLDEVVDSGQRSLISTQINSLIRNYQGKGNRIIITSRVAGYRNSPLAGEIPHYRVRDMNDEQIGRFLYQWCNAIERFQTPTLSSQTQQANAQKEIDGITSSIKGNTGVKRLATNPLLLRTLALIHRTGARLPQRRIELYKLAADTLIKDWQLARGIPEAALVNDEEATRMLSELAIWIHENKPAGLATEGEIKNKLAEVKAELAGKEPNDPEILKAVSEFLEKIRQRTGLFVERAPKRFGFMHLTFEEYFAARWLVNKPRDAAKRIRTKLHRPRWEEPILLAIAFYGMNFYDEVSDLIEEAIFGNEIGGPSPYEDILHRDLFFAVRVLGDQDVKPILQNRLLKEFCDLRFDEKGKSKFTPLQNQWEQLSKIIKNSKAGQKLVSMLLAALNDENESVRDRAAIALSNATHFPEAVSVLIATLNDENVTVRNRAAIALRNATHSPEAVSALLAALHDKKETVRASAANALRNATHSPEAVSALIAALNDENVTVRDSAAFALSNATHSPEAVSVLIATLNDENETVRNRAAIALGNATLSAEAVSALLAALNDENEAVLDNAAFALGNATLSAEAVSALIAALNDKNVTVRARATFALGNVTHSPEAVSALIVALHDKNVIVRDRAANALSNAAHSPEAVSALIAALHDKKETVRASAANALRNATHSPEAVSALIAALHDENETVRDRAAIALSNATLSAEAVSALIAALHDENETVRDNAAFALNATHSPEAVSALIAALNNENVTVRASAAFALRNATHSPEAVSALIAALHNENERVRDRAANALSNATHSLEAVSALIAALNDKNITVRDRAANALRNATQFPEAVSALIAALNDKSVIVRDRAANALRTITQNSKFKPDKDLPGQIAACLAHSGLDTSKRWVFSKDGMPIAQYTAADCLFDALMAMAGHPEVR